MVLIGACVSPDPADNENASMWFNLVEETVFDDEELCDWKSPVTDLSESLPTRSRIQALQASYMVCLYQNWEGTDSSKRRIRRNRYSTVISVARDIGIHKAKHVHVPALEVSKHVFLHFERFALREELIRVFLWVFLLDTAFVIFNNVPPRMSAKEMTMSYACSEQLFQSANPDEWASLLSDFSVHQGPGYATLLSDTTSLLCSGMLESTTQLRLAHLGPLNLFVTTSALHSLIFQFQNSFSGPIHPPSTHHAIENWRQIWQQYSTTLSFSAQHRPCEDTSPRNMWRRVGFMKHCHEYWMLARLIVMATEQRVFRSQHGHTNGKGLAPTSSEFQSGKDIPTFGLKMYDQTSMQQVNQLIADLSLISLDR